MAELTTEPTFTAKCTACDKVAAMKPSAGRLTMWTTGSMVLEYFCLGCREHQYARVVDLEVAAQLTAIGVPTSVQEAPAEMGEHPPLETAAITEIEVAVVEKCGLDIFERRVRKEFGL